MPMDFDLSTSPDDEWFNQLLDWKLNSPRELNKRRLSATQTGGAMQRQFTIELRVDYADQDKNAAMRGALQHAARHVLAVAGLITDSGVKPQIAIYSDDWFSGHEEIKLFDDIIAQGLAETSSTGDNIAAEEEVDPELVRAMQGLAANG